MSGDEDDEEDEEALAEAAKATASFDHAGATGRGGDDGDARMDSFAQLCGVRNAHPSPGVGDPGRIGGEEHLRLGGHRE